MPASLSAAAVLVVPPMRSAAVLRCCWSSGASLLADTAHGDSWRDNTDVTQMVRLCECVQDGKMKGKLLRSRYMRVGSMQHVAMVTGGEQGLCVVLLQGW